MAFSTFLALLGASWSPLGRVLAPSWRPLGPSWEDFSRFLVMCFTFFKDFGGDNGWTVGSTKNGTKRLKIARPGGMREAIRRPALLARRAGHLGVADPGFFLLSQSSCPGVSRS